MTENIFLTSLLICVIAMIVMRAFDYDELPFLLSSSTAIAFAVSLVCAVGTLLIIIWR